MTPAIAPVATGAAPSASMPSSGGRSSLPGAAFAASVVGGVQGFSSKVLGDVKAFTSGVALRTNPVPVVKSSGLAAAVSTEAEAVRVPAHAPAVRVPARVAEDRISYN